MTTEPEAAARAERARAARAERARLIIDKYEPEAVGTPLDVLAETLADEGRFVLVERSVYGPGHWITSWRTLGAAGEYHDGGEYPEDFLIVKLVDLDTGEAYYPDTQTSFTLFPDGHDDVDPEDPVRRAQAGGL